MAVRLLMGKRKRARNGYRMHAYGNGAGGGGLGYPGEDEDDVFAEEMEGEEEEESLGADGLAGSSKPLMHPREARTRVHSRRPECRCRALCRPVLYFLLMVAVMGGLVSALLYVLSKRDRGWSQPGDAAPQGDAAAASGSPQTLQSPAGATPAQAQSLVGCDRVEVSDVWVVGFPKLLTEAAFRMVDVNQDGVLDVILGIATGADGYMVPPIVCDIYFNGSFPCFGGILALEGQTGRELWRHYSQHEIFALNCNRDLDKDGVRDCLGGGRAATFEAVSGKTGRLLWIFQDKASRKRFSNFYTPQYVEDLDGDHVPDVLAIHGGDPFAEPNSKHRDAGRIMLVSGRSGQVLTWMVMGDFKESYYSPQVYYQQDGTPVVLFGTGGETHGGSLYVITLHHLKEGRLDRARAIYTDPYKGVMTPPALVDLTGDGVVDIVINPFNSSVLAFDGRTFNLLWNFTFNFSESYSTPAPGYYNDDDIPDFLVSASYGPGYPVYYHAKTNILDGKTGKPFLETPVKFSVGAQASGLSVSMEGKGHDLFLYWLADCKGHEGEGGEYKFVEGTDIHEQSRSDFCMLRFKTRLNTKMLAISSATKSPGAVIYNSEDRIQRERQNWVNTTAEAINYYTNHPQLQIDKIKQQMEEMHVAEYKNLQLERLADQALLNGDIDHAPSAKKGPQLLPFRGDNPEKETYHLQQQQQQQQQLQQQPLPPSQRSPSQQVPREQRPSPPRHRLQQQQQQQQQQPLLPQQQQQQQQLPLNRYSNSLYPPAAVAGYVDESGYQPRGDQAEEADDRGQYPYGSVDGRQDQYPRYLPGYGNGYYAPPYKNYFQKRDEKDVRTRPDTEIRNTQNADVSARGDDGLSRNEKEKHSRGEISKTAPGDEQDLKAWKSPAGIPDRQSILSEKPETGDQSESLAMRKRLKSKLRDSKTKEQPRDQTVWNLRQPERRREDLENQPQQQQQQQQQQRQQHEQRPSPMRRRKHGGRAKRHVGPHDNEGLQRLLSTGTLAPPTLPETHPDYPHSVDVVFATYWFYPAKTVAILPEDQACIDRRLSEESQRFDPKHKFYGMDHDAYEHVITEECLKRSEHQLDDEGIYESLNTYDPLNVHMGQMTVYRLRIKCTCSNAGNNTAGPRCARILPYSQQRWPAYMGRNGDSHWAPPTT